MNCAKPVIILLVHRVSDSLVSEFNNKLSLLLDNLGKENKFTFIMSDFNIDISKQYFNEQPKQEFANLLPFNSFLPLIYKPIRIAKKSASLLDIIFSKLPHKNCNSGILCTDVSDHFSVFCIMSQTSIQEKVPTISKRNFNGKNIDIFKNCLLNHNWDSVLSCNEAQRAISVLQGVIDQLIKQIFPEQTFTVNYKNRHEWMSPELRSAITKRNTMANISKQTNYRINWA